MSTGYDLGFGPTDAYDEATGHIIDNGHRLELVYNALADAIEDGMGQAQYAINLCNQATRQQIASNVKWIDKRVGKLWEEIFETTLTSVAETDVLINLVKEAAGSPESPFTGLFPAGGGQDITPTGPTSAAFPSAEIPTASPNCPTDCVLVEGKIYDNECIYTKEPPASPPSDKPAGNCCFTIVNREGVDTGKRVCWAQMLVCVSGKWALQIGCHLAFTDIIVNPTSRIFWFPSYASCRAWKPPIGQVCKPEIPEPPGPPGPPPPPTGGGYDLCRLILGDSVFDAWFDFFRTKCLLWLCLDGRWQTRVVDQGFDVTIIDGLCEYKIWCNIDDLCEHVGGGGCKPEVGCSTVLPPLPPPPEPPPTGTRPGSVCLGPPTEADKVQFTATVPWGIARNKDAYLLSECGWKELMELGSRYVPVKKIDEKFRSDSMLENMTSLFGESKDDSIHNKPDWSDVIKACEPSKRPPLCITEPQE